MDPFTRKDDLVHPRHVTERGVTQGVARGNTILVKKVNQVKLRGETQVTMYCNFCTQKGVLPPNLSGPHAPRLKYSHFDEPTTDQMV